MLVSLSIRDIVLIDRLDLDWQPCLSTLTGETGAGKSILLDALGLAIGARGDAGLVRQGCQQGTVTATFQLDKAHPVQAILRDNGLDGGLDGGLDDSQPFVDDLILRRVQSADGRSRAFCNDQPVGVSLLAQIGALLVEIHGQNENQALTDAATQRGLLDRFAGLTDALGALAVLYDTRQSARAALADYQAELTKARADTEFLSHAISELKALAPQAGEEDALANERTLLMNAEKITGDLREAEAFLQGDGGVENTLSGALGRLERAAPDAGGQLDEAVAALERATIEAGEARSAISAAVAKITGDPTRLTQVENRLFEMRGLARKHETDCDALPDKLDELEAKLAAIHGGSERLADLQNATDAADAAYREKAISVSKARQKAAARLDDMVNQELVPLKLDGGRFITEVIQDDIENGTAHGIDRLRFVASTNPGTTPGPIAKIASGGELARFMLALKVSLATAGNSCTLIFDEVDAGVGGAVAEAVGKRLHTLAQGGQVLVVTHSPQVAARGNHHWQVSKGGNGRGFSTRVAPLETVQRREEVARMLSGVDITDEARAAARRLLETG